MADAGVGEAALAESAKTAGEAVAGDALTAGVADAALPSTIAAFGPEAGGIGAGATGGTIGADALGAATTGGSIGGSNAAALASGTGAAGAGGFGGGGSFGGGFGGSGLPPVEDLSTNASATDPAKIGADVSSAVNTAGNINSIKNFGENPSLASGIGALGATSDLSGVNFSGTAGGSGLNADSVDQAFDPGSDVPSNFSPEAPATTTAPVPANGTDGMQGYVDKALKYGPIGLQAANMLGQKGQSGKYASQFEGIGNTQKQVANQMISDAQAGKINPADQYAIDQWKQDAITQAKQFYAKAGISDSTQLNGAISDINARAEAMKQQSLQTMLKTGMDALNITDKYMAQAVQAEMAGDQASAEQASNFLNAYGSWLRALPTLNGGNQQTK